MSHLCPWPVVGVGAVVWKGDRLLLVRRGRPPRQGAWSLPGGRQEPGETIHQACIREIREEAGIAIRILGLADVVDVIDRDDSQELLFHYTIVDMVAEWVAGEAVAGDDADAVAWVAAEELEDYGLPAAQRDVIAAAVGKRTVLR
jgi:ADP-ribose pyrophosphatase YjhB (NUDIX family)